MIINSHLLNHSSIVKFASWKHWFRWNNRWKWKIGLSTLPYAMIINYCISLFSGILTTDLPRRKWIQNPLALATGSNKSTSFLLLIKAFYWFSVQQKIDSKMVYWFTKSCSKINTLPSFYTLNSGLHISLEMLTLQKHYTRANFARSPGLCLASEPFHLQDPSSGLYLLWIWTVNLLDYPNDHQLCIVHQMIEL